MMEHFLESSNDFLLMSKLIQKYMDAFPEVFLKENQASDEKRLRRLIARFDNEPLLDKIGFKVEQQGNKYRYTFNKQKIDMNETDTNALMDILSLAEVSNNFHYRKDIPKLKKTLINTFNIEDEAFEIYVGHNNYDNKESNNNDKLLMIKKIIKSHNLLEFKIKYDEMNEYNERLLLKVNAPKTNEHGDLHRKNIHTMKPYLIIHDSDETFVLFKKNDFIEQKQPIEQSYFVNLSNIIFSSMSNIKNTKKGKHNIDIKDIQYTIPSRQHIKMKVSTKIGYLLETRQGNYKILNKTQHYMKIEFSEIYHALNFVFMHDGPHNLFKSFYNDDINKDILEKWDSKIRNLNNEG